MTATAPPDSYIESGDDAGVCPVCEEPLDSGRCECSEEEREAGHQGCTCRGEECTC